MKDPSRGGLLALILFLSFGTNWYLTKKVYAVKKFWHGFFLKLPAFGELIKNQFMQRSQWFYQTYYQQVFQLLML